MKKLSRKELKIAQKIAELLKGEPIGDARAKLRAADIIVSALPRPRRKK